MKTVLFALNGSWAHSALSVRALDAALREEGITPAVIEANLQDRTLSVLERLCASRGDVYGFSCYIWNIEQMLSLAADLKALRPDCHIILGGPEASFATERFAELDFIDCVIAGEGEVSFPLAVRALERGECLPRVINGVPDPKFCERGILYDKTAPAPRLVYYESSRGCPFSCAFCLSGRGVDKTALAAHAVRAKSAEKTLADLAEFEQIPGDFTVKFVDRTFNFDRERAKRIWRGLLSQSYTKTYHFEVAAQLLDEESFAILSQFPAGKLRLEIGLQSTNKETLAAISRHTDAQKVLDAAARLVRDGGVHVHLDLIAGLPHEDLASFANSFDEAYFCCHELQLGFLKLLHGTPLRQNAADFGAVFMQKPPYTVLKTDCLSFEEMSLLHAMDELTERLRDSGRFARTLCFLMAHVPSPFAFYRDLHAHLLASCDKPLQRISQRDLFWQVAQFARRILPENLHEALSLEMRADFAAAEVRRAPKGL